MDLHFNHGDPAPDERAAVDAVLGEPESGWRGGLRAAERDGHAALGDHGAGAQRHLLLPVLHSIQARLGWISPAALNYACLRLDLPPAEAYGVASFYGLFSLTSRPPRALHVCDDIACLTRGAEELCGRLEQTLGPAGSPCLGGTAIWHRSSCLGMCERAPAALLSLAGEQPRESVLAPASAQMLADSLAAEETAGPPPPPDRFDAAMSVPQSGADGPAGLKLLRRVGRVDAASLDDYRAHGGYEALRRALAKGRGWVVREVAASRLVGRGGAAFPSARKWDPANQPHYLVCNADESEPGTF